MSISVTQTASEKLQTQQMINDVNAQLKVQGRQIKQDLDKNDFLKILITQLSHQDPLQPMQDKEFIAQMAQFSSLEQITNMSTSLEKFTSKLETSQAYGLIGRDVELVTQTGTQVSGKVDAVSGKDFPQILVDGKYYDYKLIETVR